MDRLEALQTSLKQPANALSRLVDDLDKALTKPQKLVKTLDLWPRRLRRSNQAVEGILYDNTQEVAAVTEILGE